MSWSFSDITATTYVATVTATVTKSGVYFIDGGHGYLGSSTTPDSPTGVVMQETLHVFGLTPGTTYHRHAECVGGAADGTVSTLPAYAPPRLLLRGPTTVLASSPRRVRSPVVATATDALGNPLATTCTPTLLPVSAGKTQHRVRCTSAKDSYGQQAVGYRVVTVLGSDAQLARLLRTLGSSPLRRHLVAARALGQAHRTAAEARELARALEAVAEAHLSVARASSVRVAILRIGRALGRHLHVVRPGETVWGIVRAQLSSRGRPVGEHLVAFAVRRTFAANPGVRHGHGVLRPGTVLVLPF
ncbi:MAG: hypothetical protein QOI76_3751 [Frankiales bacterium]|nr:hypothetical protein [Frankiales bacterium]